MKYSTVDKAFNVIGITSGVIVLILALTINGWDWWSIMGVTGGGICLLVAPSTWRKS